MLACYYGWTRLIIFHLYIIILYKRCEGNLQSQASLAGTFSFSLRNLSIHTSSSNRFTSPPQLSCFLFKMQTPPHHCAELKVKFWVLVPLYNKRPKGFVTIYMHIYLIAQAVKYLTRFQFLRLSLHFQFFLVYCQAVQCSTVCSSAALRLLPGGTSTGINCRDLVTS